MQTKQLLWLFPLCWTIYIPIFHSILCRDNFATTLTMYLVLKNPTKLNWKLDLSVSKIILQGFYQILLQDLHWLSLLQRYISDQRASGPPYLSHVRTKSYIDTFSIWLVQLITFTTEIRSHFSRMPFLCRSLTSIFVFIYLAMRGISASLPITTVWQCAEMTKLVFKEWKITYSHYSLSSTIIRYLAILESQHIKNQASNKRTSLKLQWRKKSSIVCLSVNVLAFPTFHLTQAGLLL